MDILNNVVKKSLVKFPLPNKKHFINNTEMLDYFGNLIPYYDAHLGIDFCPKQDSIPYMKFTNNGYCYIYLDTLNIVSKEDYLEKYKKILIAAKKKNCRKFVISMYSQLETYVSHKSVEKPEKFIYDILMPFLPKQEIYLFSPDEKEFKKENAIMKQIFTGNIIYTIMDKANHTSSKSFVFDFKISYDSLVFRTTKEVKPILYIFYNDPRVKIYYAIPSDDYGHLNINFGLNVEKDNTEIPPIRFVLKFKPKIFKTKKYKTFNTENFPLKYLPNA